MSASSLDAHHPTFTYNSSPVCVNTSLPSITQSLVPHAIRTIKPAPPRIHLSVERATVEELAAVELPGVLELSAVLELTAAAAESPPTVVLPAVANT